MCCSDVDNEGACSSADVKTTTDCTPAVPKVISDTARGGEGRAQPHTGSVVAIVFGVYEAGEDVRGMHTGSPDSFVSQSSTEMGVERDGA
jgi:hypothetical protein